MSLAEYAWQTVPPAPGRAPGQETQPTPAPGAAEAPPQSPGVLGWLPFLILIPMVLLLLMSNRSQQKRTQKMLSELKKGDRVLTQGGVVGKIVEIGDRYAKIEIAPGVKIEVVKAGLLGKDNPETAATVEKK